ncbi:MAG: hypothetical protein ACRC0E_07260 [Soonwooa sp.]
MKTEINLQDHDYFNQFIYKKQISDTSDFAPVSLARVLCYVGNNHNADVKKWWLNFKTVYINPQTNEILHHLMHTTKNVGREWCLDNQVMVNNVDENYQPIPNPDFNEEEPESDVNTRYLKIPQYEKFTTILFNLLGQFMDASIDYDDSVGSFNRLNPNNEEW